MTEAPAPEFQPESLFVINVEAEERARRNGRPFNAGADGFCMACGRKVRPDALMVEVDLGGYAILPGDPRSGDYEHSQGYWQVGPECAKRVLDADGRKMVRAAMAAR